MAVIEELVHGAAADDRAGIDDRAAADHGAGVAARGRVADGTAERAARADLRAQIAGLERRIATLAAATHPRLDLSPITGTRPGAPRVLGLGDLECTRDALAERLAAMRTAAAAQAERQAVARAHLEAMLADPPAHKGLRLTNRELGLHGCTTYEVVPRFGVLGRLASWWRVKISSGCP